ncbi:MAG: hypothetical protein AAGA93_01930, partial [Actinomycetota bacterium]
MSRSDLRRRVATSVVAFVALLSLVAGTPSPVRAQPIGNQDETPTTTDPGEASDPGGSSDPGELSEPTRTSSTDPDEATEPGSDDQTGLTPAGEAPADDAEPSTDGEASPTNEETASSDGEAPTDRPAPPAALFLTRTGRSTILITDPATGSTTGERPLTGVDAAAPSGLTVDGDGEVYAADGVAGTVERFDTDDSTSTVVLDRVDRTDAAVQAGLGDAPFLPRGLAAGDDGTLYVVDAGIDRVLGFVPAGRTGTRYNRRPGVEAPPVPTLGAVTGGALRDPVDVVVVDGELLVSDRGDDDIERYDAVTGEHLGTLATLEPGDRPAGLALTDDGRLLVALSGRGAVAAIDLAAGAVDDEPLVDGLVGPSDVTVAAAGNGDPADDVLWVADAWAGTVTAHDTDSGDPTGLAMTVDDGTLPSLLAARSEPAPAAEPGEPLDGDPAVDGDPATDDSATGDALDAPPGDDPVLPTKDIDNAVDGTLDLSERTDQWLDQLGDPDEGVEFATNTGAADVDVDFALVTETYDAVIGEGEVALVAEGESVTDAVVMEVIGSAPDPDGRILETSPIRTDVDPSSENAVADALPPVVDEPGAAAAPGGNPTVDPDLADEDDAIEVEEVLPGVDVVYSADDGDVEYSFVIEPGADPDEITLDFDGAEAVSLLPNGDLLIESESGPDYRSTAPITYQEVDGEPVIIPSGYLIRDDGTVGFTLGAYDPSLPVVIDPTFVAVNSASGSYTSGSTIDLPVPTTVATDDLMLAHVAWNMWGNTNDITPPAGWNTVNETAANGLVHGVYWRIATSSEPSSYSFTLTGSTETAAGSITVYDGVDTSSPIDVSATQGNSAGAAIVAPSVTTTVDDATLVALWSVRDDGSLTQPGAMTERIDVTSSTGDTADEETVAAVAEETIGAAGSTGTRTATVDASAGSIGTLVALNPASGGGGGSNLVMVTANGGFTSGNDSAKRTLFEGWGWTVTAIDDNSSASAYSSAAAANDVMFLSDTAGNVQNNARSLDVGLVVEAYSNIENNLFASSSSQSFTSNTSITITDNSHYITSPVSTGSLTIQTSSDDVNYWRSDVTALPAGVDVLATSPTSSQHSALFVAETGGTLYSANTAPNRRVWFPSDAANPSLFTSDYETLLERSLDWAAGNDVVAAVASPTATVNSTGDSSDNNAGDDICDTGNTNAAGEPECTLRAAIQEANASSLTNTIRFLIPTADSGQSSGVWTISSGSALPTITAPVVVDGTTQDGYSTPVVAIDGSSQGSGDGLVVSGDDVTIRGLNIHSMPGDGVQVTGDRITFTDNHIGTNAAGTAVDGNGDEGVQIDGADAVVSGNIISASGQNGLTILGDGHRARVVGNKIGTDVTGNVGFGNGQEGIEITGADDVVIGEPGNGNVISGNAYAAINGWNNTPSNTVVQANLIGVGADGTTSLPNSTTAGEGGITIRTSAQDWLIGGTGAGEGNTIANNIGDGIQLEAINGTGDNVAILGNSIRANTGLGIDLVDDGVTANDASDLDTGPNDLLNFPVVTSTSESGGTITVDYDLDVPSGNYRIEFSTNPSGADPDGHGEGETFVHAHSIAHTGSGVESFSTTFAGSTGAVVTATATEDLGSGNYGSTSEFSLEAYVAPTSLDPVVLDGVQSGTTTLPSGSTSVTVTIDAVDTTSSFLEFGVRGTGTEPGRLQIIGELTNSTTVTFTRDNTGVDVVIDWSVVEFSSGVTVQRGVSSNSGGAVVDTTISAVDRSRSFVLLGGYQVDGVTFDGNDFVQASLTSATNLRLAVDFATPSTVPWQVITYNDATVQRGTASFGASDASATAAVSTVDTTKAWLVYNYSTTAGTTTNIGQKLVRGRITDATTLTFDRSSTGQAVDLRWELIEFTDSTTVQHASASFGTSVSAQGVTISAVDRGRAIATGGYLGQGGRTPFASDDNPNYAWFTSELIGATELRLQRGVTGAAADLGWFVIEWVCADSDADGITDCHEDANTDGDNDPSTNPGPDTDGDTTPDYLDSDDDGDGSATSSENADPNGDGDPRDALDADRDAQPDYLDVEVTSSGLPVLGEQKISASVGGLSGPTNSGGNFGSSAAAIGDIDGDGINDVAVGAQNDGDGGTARGAVYVLFLNADGTVKGEQKISSTQGGLTGPLTNADLFGRDIEGLGDVDGDGIGDIAVGAFGDDTGGGSSGAIYVLLLNADGTVKGEQLISEGAGGFTTALDPEDRFGLGIAAIGDVDGNGVRDVAVGAPRDDDGGTDRGAVYVLFLEADGTVVGEQKISDTTGGLAAALDNEDHFGESLTSPGDVDGDGVVDLAVAVGGDDDGGTDRGAVYVLFLNSDGTVKGEQKISQSTGGGPGLDDGDAFGSDVTGIGDLDGDGVEDLAVGAIGDDDGGTDRGALYLLTLASDGTVSATEKLSSTAGSLTGPLDDSDEFGSGLAGIGDLDGDGGLNLVVGAHLDDDGGSARGAVYVLDLSSGCLDTTDTDSDGLYDCFETPFGDTDGDTTPNELDADDDGDGTNTSAENADPNGDGSPQDAVDTNRNGIPDYLDVGASPSHASVAGEQKISDSLGGLTATIDDSDMLGQSLASIGDVDGDGIADLAIGAPGDDDGGSARGAVHILFLNTDGTVKGEQKISDTAGGLTATLTNSDEFGHAISGLGDVDGDGIADIAVGTWGDDDGGTDRGGIHVLFLNADGTVKGEQKISDTAGGLAATLDDGDRFGAALSGLGDVDGDGINDLAVDARYDDDGGTGRGAVYVLFLDDDGTVKGEQKISDTAGGLTAALENGDNFGSGTAGIGDLDGDGVPDLVVGATGDDDGGSATGAVYVLLLNSDGTVKGEQKISDTTGGLVNPIADNQLFGRDVTGLGDYDGDGTIDIAVGNWAAPGTGSARGGIRVLSLDAAGRVIEDRIIDDVYGGLTALLDANDRFGTSVASLGDLDGDGGLNLAVGARYDDDGGTDRGAAYILDLRTRADADGDGLWDHREDADTDLDGNPATSPGPDTDGDTTVDYLDPDDDGDGAATTTENADPNGDGHQRDARDSDHDGQPDYLDPDVGSGATPVRSEQKISDTTGDLSATLDDSDAIGTAVASIGDLDGDGIGDLVVGAPEDDDGGAGRGAVHVLFLDADGTVASEQKLSSTTGGLTGPLDNGDRFGASVAAIGDVDGDGVLDLAVGADQDDDGGSDRGAVYVLLMNTDGTVRAEQKISVVSGGFTGSVDGDDEFGYSVGAIGDLDADGVPDLAVGAIRDDDGGGTNRGAVYVLFLNTDGTVKGEQKISDATGGLLASLVDNDWFGSSVAGIGDLDGDGISDLAVGALRDDDGGGTNRGAVYVLFLNTDGTVKGEQKISSSTGGLTGPLVDNTWFGSGVAGVGDVDRDGVEDLVVGAAIDSDGGTFRGAAFLLFLNTDGTVKGEAKISSTAGGLTGSLDDSDGFGTDVAGLGDLDGDGGLDLAVGTAGDDDGGTDRGAVYVLDLSVAPCGTTDSDSDGLLDCEEDANSDADDDPSTNPGPDTDGDTIANYLDADDDGDGTNTSAENADPNGDGDPRDARDADRDGEPDYLDAPTNSSELPVTSEQKISDTVGGFTASLDNSDQFGRRSTSIGDLDGDGVVDLAVGAQGDDDGGTDRGAVHVLFLDADGTVKAEQKISDTAGGLAATLDDDDDFGSGAAGPGDIDGDGIPDLVVGATGDDDGGSDRGAVYVLFLDADGTVREEQKISDTTGGLAATLDNDDGFGEGIGGLGDVDGDGVPDIAVGAPWDDDGGGSDGAVYVLFLNPDGTVKAEQKISDTAGGLTASLDGGHFGSSVSGIGDVDNDGVPDLIAGANYDDTGGSLKGAAYVLRLNSDGTVKGEQKIAEGTGGFGATLDAVAQMGTGVAGVGDIDSDGVSDVVVGVPLESTSNTGSVFVLTLNTDGTVKTTTQLGAGDGGLTGPLDNNDFFGQSVTGLGDLDGDGTIGLAIGAYGDDDGGSLRGAVYVVDLTTGACGVADSDSDGLLDCEEDADTDSDRDPSTTPGPDTDGDTTPNHLDADDDGDGAATSAENADPNGDGDPRDAVDSDRDGEPDWLDAGTPSATSGYVAATQKISDTTGGLAATLVDGGQFGADGTSLGDVDGDGINDMAVGASNDGPGAVHVLFLNADGTVKGEQKIANGVGGLTTSLSSGDDFGRGLAGLGDVDGDGIPDLAVGAMQDDDGGSNYGAIYILFLNADGTVKGEQKISSTTGGLTATLSTWSGFGLSMAGLGDLDGDGIPDLAAPARWDDDGGNGRGAVHVLFLNANGTVKSEQKISDTVGGFTETLDDDDNFGSGVASIGDLDGDGTTDLAVGAALDDDGGTDRGAVYILLLGSDGTVSSSSKISDTTGALAWPLPDNGEFGVDVHSPGDLDVDGNPDLVVGTWGDAGGGTNRGAFYVVFLADDGSVKDHRRIDDTRGGAAATIDDDDRFGAEVWNLGDLDGDGVPSIAVGARNDDDEGSDRGAVYVLELRGRADSDGDGLWDHEEDADGDLDGDPATTPGPDTDGDTTPDYLDSDDDADAAATTAENADPDSDGDPRDALDSDRDGQPDYLDPPTSATVGTVADEQKISSTAGGLTGPLDDDDAFGPGVAPVGDLDGDGVNDIVVGSATDDDGGSNRGAIYVLFLNADGSVKGEQKISDTAGGLAATLDDGDFFGEWVGVIGDLDGDRRNELIVGARYDADGGTGRGAVYVLFLNADGTVRAEQKISDTTGGLSAALDDNDNFGVAVGGVGDVDGDGVPDVVVGANGDDDGGADRGAAYVLFLNADGTVRAEQKVSDTAGGFGATLDDNDNVGEAVTGPGDIDGDGTPDLAIGAYGDDDGGADRGAAYVLFLNANGTVKGEQKISDTAGGLTTTFDDSDWFGGSVGAIGDLDGDGVNDLLVGVPGADDGGSQRGAVEVLLLRSDGTVKTSSRISDTSGNLATALDDGDWFGISVSGLGDLDGNGTIDIAVGASYDDDGGTNRGAVHVLDLSLGCSPGDSDSDTVLDCFEDADADADDDPSTNPGPDTDGDTTPNYLDADDDGDTTPTASERPDPSGDGNPRDAIDSDHDGEPDFLDPPTDAVVGQVASEQKISATQGGLSATLDSFDLLGQGIASIGDLDGDGVVDLAVGAYQDDDGGSSRGAVHILFLNANGTVRAEQKISDTTGGFAGVLDDSDQFGRNVASLGDLDGDGNVDIAVGAFRDDDGGSNHGAVYILFLDDDGTVKAEQKLSETEGGLGVSFAGTVEFGRDVAGLGDVDGDGINDLAVGSTQDDDGGADRGAVYVVLLNTDGTAKSANKISDTSGGLTATLDDDDELGAGLAGIGDLDGDGVRDLVVGAAKDDDGDAGAGALHVLFLNADGTVKAEQKISDTAGGLAADLGNGDAFGSSVAAVGDLDGDGIVDLAVGAPGDDDGSGSAGAVYLLFLDRTGMVRNEAKISATSGGLTGPLDGFDSFGVGVTSLGDLDGDGTISLAVGAHGDDDGASSAGAVYVLELTDACSFGTGYGSACPFASLAAVPDDVDGRFWFDFGGGAFEASVSSDEGGAWVQVLQYNHDGGTNPTIDVRAAAADWPTYSNVSRGTDQSGTQFWGHTGQAAAAAIPDAAADLELRWYGESSGANRIIHFRSPVLGEFQSDADDDFLTGGIAASHALLSGHSANLPTSTDSAFSDQGDGALTEFPYFTSGANHWGVRGLSGRWEADDPTSGSSLDTLHRVWVRVQRPDLTVNSTGDGGDTSAGDGVCSTGGTIGDGTTECTLRAAIEEANANASIT